MTDLTLDITQWLYMFLYMFHSDQQVCIHTHFKLVSKLLLKSERHKKSLLRGKENNSCFVMEFLHKDQKKPYNVACFTHHVAQAIHISWISSPFHFCVTHLHMAWIYRTEVIGQVEAPVLIADWKQVRLAGWLEKKAEDLSEDEWEIMHYFQIYLSTALKYGF